MPRAFSAQVEIRAHQVELPRYLGQFIKDKLASKLAKFSRAVERVMVRFEDVNGSARGGEDVLCKVQVWMPGKHTEVVQDRGTNPRHAFEIVTHELVHAVQRTVDRSNLVTGRGRRSVRKEAVMAASNKPKRPRIKSGAQVSPPLLKHSRGTAAITEPDQRGGPANWKAATSKATRQIETTTGKASRKSTRRGANRVKPDATLTGRVKAEVTTPRRVAERGLAGRKPR